MNAVLEAVHSQGQTQQFKIGLPFALVKLSQQNSFEIIKRLIGVVASINFIKNVPKDCLGKLARSLAYVSFLVRTHAQPHTPLHPHCSQPLLVCATLCHNTGTQASQLHPPLPAKHPLLPFLSRAVTTSLSVLETLFQDLGGRGDQCSRQPHKGQSAQIVMNLGGPSLA